MQRSLTRSAAHTCPVSWPPTLLLPQGIVNQILTYGKVVRPVVGVTLAPPQVLERLKVQGVLILDVSPNSPGAKAGLLPSYRARSGDLVLGDIIVGIDGEPVLNYSDLFDALDRKKAGDTIALDVLRATADGKFEKVQLPVELREQSPQVADG